MIVVLRTRQLQTTSVSREDAEISTPNGDKEVKADKKIGRDLFGFARRFFSLWKSFIFESKHLRNIKAGL